LLKDVLSTRDDKSEIMFADGKASLFYFYFFPDSPTEVTRAWNFTNDGSKRNCDVRKCLFGSTRWPTKFWGSNSPKKLSKMAFYRHVQAATNSFKTNDVIED